MNTSALRRFKPNKTVVILGVAIAIGLLAALAARSYLNNRVQAIEAQALGKTVELVVASHDLDKGAVVSEDTVSVRHIPIEYAHDAAIAPAAFDRIAGEKLAYPVKSGQMILWGLLETKRVPTFSTRVEVGRRAMTVPVDEINSISGMLEPGDVIDLVVTVDQDGRKVTVPVLQSVQVLATGQRAVDDPKSGERREFSTVTLDTTPEQAQNVIMAREGGKVTALLRNPQDKTPLKDVGTDIGSLLRGRVQPARAAAVAVLPGQPQPSRVPVLYGGHNSNFTPEQLNLDMNRKVAESMASQSLNNQSRVVAANERAAAAAEQAARDVKALVGGRRDGAGL